MASFKLDDTDKHSHPYKVPEGYFDELNQTIMERTSAQPDTRVVRWYGRPSLQWAMASMVVVAVVFASLFNGPTATEEDFLADVTDEEILIYLASNDLSTEEIMTHFTFTEDEFAAEEENTLDDIEFDDSMLDDMLLEYELEDDPIQI